MPTLATDNFNRADAANLGANWSQAAGSSNTLGIFSNTVDVNAANVDCSMYRNDVVWPNDQYSQATMLTAAVHNSGVIVRAATAVSANYYAGGSGEGLFGNRDCRIWKRVSGGAGVSIASNAQDTIANDVIRLEAQGTSLTLFRNGGSLISTTDSDIASGSAGLQVRFSATNTGTWDNWEGGDFAVAGGTNRWLALLGVGS